MRARNSQSHEASAAASLQTAVSFTDTQRLVRFLERLTAGSAANWPRLLGLEAGEFATLTGGRNVSRIHFGNEFCERLLPSRTKVETALKTATACGLGFGLALPILTDEGIAQADELLGAMPDGTEVTVNDWGLMRRMGRRFPALRAIAGRLLCKILKEPRVPSATYMELGGHGFMTPGLEALFARMGVGRVEIDVPPFARTQDLSAPRLRVSAHVPFGFATTGRICRIGNLRQPGARKFATDHSCARECLTYLTGMTAPREPGNDPMVIFQRGNTTFYRHTAAMTAALAEAVAAGTVDRVVISGDWNENRSSDLDA